MSSLNDDLMNVIFSDLKLGDKIAIEMPAASWAMLLEWFTTVEDKSNTAIRLGNLIWTAITPEHYRQALEAKRSEHNPFAEQINQLKSLGVPVMGLADDGTQLSLDDLAAQMRCLVCNRVPNRITEPCSSCPDYLKEPE